MTINTPFIAGSILTAAQMSNLPFGVAGYVSLTSLSQTGITTATDITGATITFTAVANRPYAIFSHGYHNTTANDVTVGVLLKEGATTLTKRIVPQPTPRWEQLSLVLLSELLLMAHTP